MKKYICVISLLLSSPLLLQAQYQDPGSVHLAFQFGMLAFTFLAFYFGKISKVVVSLFRHFRKSADE